MIFLYSLVLYFIILYIVTTIRLLNANSYTKIQKFIQLNIIWLIPIIGVIPVALFLNQEPITLKKSSFLIKIFLFLFLIEVDKKKSLLKYPDSNEHYTDDGYIGVNTYDNCSFGGCDSGGD